MRHGEILDQLELLTRRIDALNIQPEQVHPVQEVKECCQEKIDLEPINTLLEELKKSITELKRRNTNIEKQLEELKRKSE